MTAMIAVDFLNSFILTFLCFFWLLCYYLFFKRPKDGFDLPRSPPSLPIIVHLHLLLYVLPHKAFQKISSRYGPLLQLCIFKVPLCLVSSASVAYEIFRTHDVNVSSRGKPLKKLGISLFEKEIRRVSSRFDELLERHLREHEEKPEKHQNTDMMDVLLAASRDENADYKITRNHIKLLLVELFLGGTDSAAKLIQWGNG
ncbi:hypothetical protein IGI04_020447 [Brassica rapa subsp. trilocularis]|uniref:Cytochrome P450 n=1 Tax=Brassica rapa subsp. trilocularis TaxID=1813537 RepID=A0ABQ7MIR0_BRACM|nr:hypothetical protein IGI04_020447 [Brassica rapa subsp. trilocularis]